MFGAPAPSEPGIPPAAGSDPGTRARRARALSLTLLDGTTIRLPNQPTKKEPSGLTARDIVSALRAASHGADADSSIAVGENLEWEPVVAALLSILLRKGLIADWELVEELRKGG